MRKLNNIGIFCGSSTGNQSIYTQAAENLIDAMYAKQIALVYGGAKVGLMGVIADRMLQQGGDAIGVIPQALADIEISHEDLTELHIVDSMHERKLRIAELSDAFIMLPGGPGSLDEFFEMFTLGQLGFHTKPCGILNVDGYYNDLLKCMGHMVVKGFLKAIHCNMIIVDEFPEALIDRMMNYQAPTDKKWIKELVEKV